MWSQWQRIFPLVNLGGGKRVGNWGESCGERCGEGVWWGYLSSEYLPAASSDVGNSFANRIFKMCWWLLRLACPPPPWTWILQGYVSPYRSTRDNHLTAHCGLGSIPCDGMWQCSGRLRVLPFPPPRKTIKWQHPRLPERVYKLICAFCVIKLVSMSSGDRAQVIHNRYWLYTQTSKEPIKRFFIFYFIFINQRGLPCLRGIHNDGYYLCTSEAKDETFITSAVPVTAYCVCVCVFNINRVI